MAKFIFTFGKRQVSASTGSLHINQCQKPTGLVGRFVLWRMNSSHSKLTDWGLRHITIKSDATILDIGCGGGRTVDRLAATATAGKIYGVDFSEDSVAATRRTNAQWIRMGRVDVRHGSASALPFSENMFDIVTAVETHFWWSDLLGSLCEIWRVLKPHGQLALIAEIYKGANTLAARLAEQHEARTGMALLTLEEHRQLLAGAGFVDVQIDTDVDRGWMCATGRKSA